MKDAIAVRIKELRLRNRYTQNQVAQRLCISQAAYSLIENGQNGVSVEHLVRLGSLYDKTTDFMILGKE